MWPAWYYLIGIRARDKIDMRARTARVASWGRDVENVLVFDELARAPARAMKTIGCFVEALLGPNVFYVEFVAELVVLDGFRHARARMWPGLYYLIGIRARDKFDMRARAARVASWDRNVEHV